MANICLLYTSMDVDDVCAILGVSKTYAWKLLFW